VRVSRGRGSSSTAPARLVHGAVEKTPAHCTRTRPRPRLSPSRLLQHRKHEARQRRARGTSCNPIQGKSMAAYATNPSQCWQVRCSLCYVTYVLVRFIAKLYTTGTCILSSVQYLCPMSQRKKKTHKI
jgi:hypothetical protein